jgi:hypothetical protein
MTRHPRFSGIQAQIVFDFLEQQRVLELVCEHDLSRNLLSQWVLK